MTREEALEALYHRANQNNLFIGGREGYPFQIITDDEHREPLEDIAKVFGWHSNQKEISITGKGRQMNRSPNWVLVFYRERAVEVGEALEPILKTAKKGSRARYKWGFLHCALANSRCAS